MGTFLIEKRLNQAKVPSWGPRGKGWSISYVYKMLNGRAELGEFQPCRRVEKRRVPVGDPIPGYYPAIVKEQLFYSAQAGLSPRRGGRGGGRRGDRVANLFSKIATCWHCGSKMRFENKGRGHGKYLVCDNARRGMGCQRVGWRYEHFETSFLTFVRELDLESLARGPDEGGRQAEVEASIIALEGRKAEAERAEQKLFELLPRVKDTQRFTRRLNDLTDQLAGIEAERKQLEDERQRLAHHAVERDGAELKSLIARLQARNGTFALRVAVASRLQSFVVKLTVFIMPLKHGGFERSFSVYFQNDHMRAVTPDPNDPTKLDSMVWGHKDEDWEITTEPEGLA